MRNYDNPNSTGDKIFGKELFRTTGQSDTLFSYDAVANAVAKIKTSYKVKSWRKVE